MTSFNPDRVDVYIEIQGLYDGWSVAKMKDGSLVNRWNPDDYRYKATQEWIDNCTPGEIE